VRRKDGIDFHDDGWRVWGGWAAQCASQLGHQLGVADRVRRRGYQDAELWAVEG
jgi:hypothetical protein